jgi:hypothetical protein
MEHDTAGLNGKIFEMMKKDMAGLVVVEYVVEGSRMAVHSPSSDPRYLAGV